jgi:O-antigen ligase
VWALALERSVTAPWLGYGIGDPQDFLIWGGQLLIIHPHNVLLAHLLVGGLPAVALFLVLVTLVLAVGLRVFLSKGDYLLIGLLVFVGVCGLVDLEVFLGPLDIEWLYFWLPIGLAAAASSSDRRSEHGL